MVKRQQRLGERRLGFERLERRLVLAGNGLTAQYFFNADFTGLADTRVEAVAQNWGTAGPGAGVGADNFSVRWTGQIEPQFSQEYTFRLTSDQAARLWIGGQLLIDDWASHAVRSRTATINMVAGQLYDIRLDYFEGTGPAQVQLEWSSTSQPLQVIPASRLYESPAGLLGTYRDSNGANVSRIDSAVNFNWATGAPVAGVAVDNFWVNWTGQIRADFADTYTFKIATSDRVRLRIGDELVIDNWEAPITNNAIGTKWLEPGKWYDIRVEFADDSGTASVQFQWASPLQTADQYYVVPQANLRATAAASFQNPLGAGADPWVVYENGYYYLARSQGNSVWITRATSLEDIHQNSGRSTSVRAWAAPAGTAYSSQIWAPELHHFNGNWYIYVAASDGDNANHRMQVLQRTGNDPFGTFSRVGQLAAQTDRWAIDGTAFEWNGSLYFVWSGWPGSTDGLQNLYIARMQNPTTISGERVLLSAPTLAWERHGLPINEGPEILVHDGTLSIIYSGSGYWSNDYALGRLTFNGTGSVLDPTAWTKSQQPVFQKTSAITGVGHASFTTSPDGSENWIVYHAHADPAVFNEDRVIRIQPFTFNADGTPNFGKPLPPLQSLIVPSAVADPERAALVADYQADGAVNDSDYNVWRATFGKTAIAGIGADGSSNGAVDAADYVLWRSRQSSAAAGSAATWAQPVSASLISAAVVATKLTNLSRHTRGQNGGFPRMANQQTDDNLVVCLPNEKRDALSTAVTMQTGTRAESVDEAFATAGSLGIALEWNSDLFKWK
jgi:GH43 family beta-xylosidase